MLAAIGCLAKRMSRGADDASVEDTDQDLEEPEVWAGEKNGGAGGAGEGMLAAGLRVVVVGVSERAVDSVLLTLQANGQRRLARVGPVPAVSPQLWKHCVQESAAAVDVDLVVRLQDLLREAVRAGDTARADGLDVLLTQVRQGFAREDACTCPVRCFCVLYFLSHMNRTHRCAPSSRCWGGTAASTRSLAPVHHITGFGNFCRSFPVLR